MKCSVGLGASSVTFLEKCSLGLGVSSVTFEESLTDKVFFGVGCVKCHIHKKSY